MKNFTESELMDFLWEVQQNPKCYSTYVVINKKGNRAWNRVRHFSSVLYPNDGIDIPELCKNFPYQCCLSPLHDSDIKDTDTGELKAKHYHFIMTVKGKISTWQFYQALSSTFGLNQFNTLETVGDISKLVRYHIHLDDPDKFQYDPSNILDFGGFSSLKYLGESGDLMTDLLKLKNIVREKSFLFYAELDDYLEENDTVLWTSLHMNRSLQKDILDYCKSREYLMQYQGLVEKGYTKIKLSDNTEKVIFNRQIINQDAI